MRKSAGPFVGCGLSGWGEGRAKLGVRAQGPGGLRPCSVLGAASQRNPWAAPSLSVVRTEARAEQSAVLSQTPVPLCSAVSRVENGCRGGLGHWASGSPPGRRSGHSVETCPPEVASAQCPLTASRDAPGAGQPCLSRACECRWAAGPGLCSAGVRPACLSAARRPGPAAFLSQLGWGQVRGVSAAGAPGAELLPALSEGPCGATPGLADGSFRAISWAVAFIPHGARKAPL